MAEIEDYEATAKELEQRIASEQITEEERWELRRVLSKVQRRLAVARHEETVEGDS